MSTVAWDGQMLACDSQTTCNDIIVSLDAKKSFTDGKGTIVAGVGTHSLIAEWAEWFLKTPMLAEPDLEDSVVFVVKNGVARYYDKHGSLPITGPQAIGSGMVVALAAMKAGKNARDAVAIACELDVYSGGEIVSYCSSDGCMG